MMTIYAGAMTPDALGLAFNVSGALIALRAANALSDRGVAGLAGTAALAERGARDLCRQRFDLRWAGLFLIIGFTLQLIGSAFPAAVVDARFLLALVVGLATYLANREASIRHDLASGVGLGSGRIDTENVTRFPLAAA